MPTIIDGPASALFSPVKLRGNIALEELARAGMSQQMAAAVPHAPSGECVSWGIPFTVGKPVLVKGKSVRVKVKPVIARWLVFMHTSDVRPIEPDSDGFIRPMTGEGRLNEHAADYVVIYADGTEERVPIRRRHHVGPVQRRWGENCFQCVPHLKPRPTKSHPDDRIQLKEWGGVQFRVANPQFQPWMNWLYAWENPQPKKQIVGLRFEPVEASHCCPPSSGALVVSAVTAGNVSETPLRWGTRRKAILRLPKGERFDPAVNDAGLFKQIQLDLGQVISATPRTIYPNSEWAHSYNNQLPAVSEREVIVEYAAHPEARFHLPGGRAMPAAKLESAGKAGSLQVVPPSAQRVTIRAVEKSTGKPVAVKLHVHGEAGEYLAPVDRDRVPNPMWLQDFGIDFSHRGIHQCTYIPGEAQIDLPLGRAFIEVSKGFEIRPVRKIVSVTKATSEIVVEIEKVLPWRENGWVTADTHVHFLSPQSAMLEGRGEGVNIVNLLATQWGEMVTNVADFDGKTTFGSKDAGGDGEYMVRVGTENRQNVFGHISLLGYSGRIIAPMTTGGPDESALGDPIARLLTEWARQCRTQGGIVVIPHFPNPRCEHAVTIVSGDADAVEMTSWGSLYGGIDPYSLSDWYRYLNCGYPVAAVAGTDKMSADTAVGTVRTYARIAPGREFTYDAWMDAIRAGDTFATYGPLLEFSVEGNEPGSRITMTRSGGTVNVAWKVASVTVPMSRVELIVNGEIRESKAVRPDEDAGTWAVKIDRSSWLALLVRGHYADKPEIIAAHSSPVSVQVEGTKLLAAADAMTILEQIEGALAFFDQLGTRAETKACKRMRLVLTRAHRSLHNRMHAMGKYHGHATG